MADRVLIHYERQTESTGHDGCLLFDDDAAAGRWLLYDKDVCTSIIAVYRARRVELKTITKTREEVVGYEIGD